MNLRPSGYEPDELPSCSTPHQRRRIIARLNDIYKGSMAVLRLPVIYLIDSQIRDPGGGPAEVEFVVGSGQNPGRRRHENLIRRHAINPLDYPCPGAGSVDGRLATWMSRDGAMDGPTGARQSIPRPGTRWEIAGTQATVQNCSYTCVHQR